MPLWLPKDSDLSLAARGFSASGTKNDWVARSFHYAVDHSFIGRIHDPILPKHSAIRMLGDEPMVVSGNPQGGNGGTYFPEQTDYLFLLAKSNVWKEGSAWHFITRGLPESLNMISCGDNQRTADYVRMGGSGFDIRASSGTRGLVTGAYDPENDKGINVLSLIQDTASTAKMYVNGALFGSSACTSFPICTRFAINRQIRSASTQEPGAPDWTFLGFFQTESTTVNTVLAIHQAAGRVLRPANQSPYLVSIPAAAANEQPTQQYIPRNSDLGRALDGWPGPRVKPIEAVKPRWDSFVRPTDWVHILRSEQDGKFLGNNHVLTLQGDTAFERNTLHIGDDKDSTTNGVIAEGLGNFIAGAGSLGICIEYDTKITDEFQPLIARWEDGPKIFSLYLIHHSTNKVRAIIPASSGSSVQRTGRFSETLIGNYHRCVINWNGGNSWDMWIDGKKHALEVFDDYNVSTLPGPSDGDLYLGRSTPNSPGVHHGNIHNIIIRKDDVFSEGEAFDYMRDPYAWLKPANQAPYLFSIPAAAANETTPQYIPRNSDLGRALDGWPSSPFVPGSGSVLNTSHPAAKYVKEIWVPGVSHGLVRGIPGVWTNLVFFRGNLVGRLDVDPLPASLWDELRTGAAIVKGETLPHTSAEYTKMFYVGYWNGAANNQRVYVENRKTSTTSISHAITNSSSGVNYLSYTYSSGDTSDLFINWDATSGYPLSSTAEVNTLTDGSPATSSRNESRAAWSTGITNGRLSAGEGVSRVAIVVLLDYTFPKDRFKDVREFPEKLLRPVNQAPYLVSIPASEANEETVPQYIPRNSDLGRALDGWPGPRTQPSSLHLDRSHPIAAGAFLDLDCLKGRLIVGDNSVNSVSGNPDFVAGALRGNGSSIYATLGTEGIKIQRGSPMLTEFVFATTSTAKQALCGTFDTNLASAFRVQVNALVYNGVGSPTAKIAVYVRDDSTTGAMDCNTSIAVPNLLDGRPKHIAVFTDPKNQFARIWVDGVEYSMTYRSQSAPNNFPETVWDWPFAVGAVNMRGTIEGHIDGELRGFRQSAVSSAQAAAAARLGYWARYQPTNQAPYLISVPSAEPSVIALAVANALHGQTAEVLTLSQLHDLLINNADHPLTSAIAALAQQHVVALQDANHALASDEATLAQVQALLVDAALHGVISGEPTLEQVHDLLIEAAIHGHTAEVLTLLQIHDLVIAPASHALDSDQVTFQQVYDLVIAAAQHSLTSDEATLTQLHQLVLQDSAHGLSSTVVTLAQVHSLLVDAASHALTSDNMDLSGAALLAIQSAFHGHVVDNALLNTLIQVTIADAQHALASDETTLAQIHSLLVDPAQHGLTSDNAVVAEAIALLINAAVHAHTVDTATINQLHDLFIEAATHGHTAENAVLTPAGVLAIFNATHAVSSDTATLSQIHDVFVDEALHGHSVTGLLLSMEHLVSIDNAAHALLAEQAGITQGYLLDIQNALHGQFVDSIAFNQQHLLVVNDALHDLIFQNIGLFEGDIVVNDNRLILVKSEGRYIILAGEERIVSLDPEDRTLDVESRA